MHSDNLINSRCVGDDDIEGQFITETRLKRIESKIAREAVPKAHNISRTQNASKTQNILFRLKILLYKNA